MTTETNTTPTGKPSTVTLTIDISELNIIVGGLHELPYRVVDPVIKKIFQQAEAQLGPPQG